MGMNMIKNPLRDRIRRAICEAEGFAWDSDLLEPDEYGDIADAVLAVLPAPAPAICEIPHATVDEEDACERARLGAANAARAVFCRLRAHLAGFQDVLDDSDRGPWANTVGADLDELGALLDANPTAEETRNA